MKRTTDSNILGSSPTKRAKPVAEPNKKEVSKVESTKKVEVSKVEASKKEATSKADASKKVETNTTTIATTTTAVSATAVSANAAAAAKTKKEADRPTVPMNISEQLSELEQFLPHIESLSIPPEMSAQVIKRIFPSGVPSTAVPAVNNMLSIMNVLGPVPNSINPIFTMAMGGFNANDAGAAQHALSLDIISQLSAAMRAKTPHVQHNRIRFDTSIQHLKSVVQEQLSPQFEGVDEEAADRILSSLERDILQRQNPFDESRNLGLFVRGVGLPSCNVRLPEFTISDILRNLTPSKSENDENACVWGKMCMALTHGSQLTFRTRNTKRVPLIQWSVAGDPTNTYNKYKRCLLCEVVHTNGLIRKFQRWGRSPPRILQQFKVVCDSEIGLPADALLFADAAFNGLVAPFINGDWLFAHLIAPPEDGNEPYRILRGYFVKR